MLCIFCKNSPITFQMTHVQIVHYSYYVVHADKVCCNLTYSTCTGTCNVFIVVFKQCFCTWLMILVFDELSEKLIITVVNVSY